MKLMPALPESIFDICYLIFAVISGILLLKSSKGRKELCLYGAMTLLLGCGDAFHLVPRVLNYWTDADYTAALGIGKLITSVTMTLFYLLIEYVYLDDRDVYKRNPKTPVPGCNCRSGCFRLQKQIIPILPCSYRQASGAG